MTNNVTVDGLALDIVTQDLAAGKQGKVHLAVLSDAPNHRMILKEMWNQPTAWPRTQL